MKTLVIASTTAGSAAIPAPPPPPQTTSQALTTTVIPPKAETSKREQKYLVPSFWSILILASMWWSTVCILIPVKDGAVGGLATLCLGALYLAIVGVELALAVAIWKKGSI